MSGSASAFRPLEATTSTAKRPDLRKAGSANFAPNFLRQQLAFQTWMILGAAVQIALFALPIKPYYAATPVIAYLVKEIVGTLMIVVGLREDPEWPKALEAKYTALRPSEDGQFKMGTSGDKVSVFILGFRVHHHLGMLAPGFKEVADYAGRMFQELDDKANVTGLLGQSTYTSASNNRKNGEILTIMYFKSNADVIRYATGPLHREAWEWYNKAVKQHKHLGIMHELYEAPAGQWENVYKNMEPTLFAATKHMVVDADGEEKWISPVVDATRGKTATTAGRVA